MKKTRLLTRKWITILEKAKTLITKITNSFLHKTNLRLQVTCYHLQCCWVTKQVSCSCVFHLFLYYQHQVEQPQGYLQYCRECWCDSNAYTQWTHSLLSSRTGCCYAHTSVWMSSNLDHVASCWCHAVPSDHQHKGFYVWPSGLQTYLAFYSRICKFYHHCPVLSCWTDEMAMVWKRQHL